MYHKRPPVFVSIVFACPYLSTTPRTEDGVPSSGTHSPAVHSASLEFHHPVAFTGLPPLVATAYDAPHRSKYAKMLRISAYLSHLQTKSFASTLDIWPDRSIINAPACHRLPNGCAVRLESILMWLADLSAAGGR